MICDDCEVNLTNREMRTTTENRILHASIKETINGKSPGFNCASRQGIAYLDVTAKSGILPRLKVFVEELDPLSKKWFPIAAFDRATGITKERTTVSFIASGKIRTRWRIRGSGNLSFTFSVGFSGKEVA